MWKGPLKGNDYYGEGQTEVSVGSTLVTLREGVLTEGDTELIVSVREASSTVTEGLSPTVRDTS